MQKVLLDTDVILDFLFDRAPYADNAARILSLCEAGTINGYVTPVICSNVYYLLRQTSRHEKVIEKLSQLMSIVDVLPMNREVVIQALNSGFKDFEDALQNFSALQSNFIEVIITRNEKDFTKSSLGVMNPDSYLKHRTGNKTS